MLKNPPAKPGSDAKANPDAAKAPDTSKPSKSRGTSEITAKAAQSLLPVVKTPFTPDCKGQGDVLHHSSLEHGGCRIIHPGNPEGVGQCADPSQLYKWATWRENAEMFGGRLDPKQVLMECLRPAMHAELMRRGGERRDAEHKETSEATASSKTISSKEAASNPNFTSSKKATVSSVRKPSVAGGLFAAPKLAQAAQSSRPGPSMLKRATSCDCDAWGVAAAALLAAAANPFCAGGLGPALQRRNKGSPVALSALLRAAAAHVGR
jgi:hypothetical protein